MNTSQVHTREAATTLLVNPQVSEAKALRHLVHPERTAIDVGGGEGADTFLLAELARTVHVFEPIPELHRILADAFADSGKVQVHRLALSDRVGTAKLRIHTLEKVGRWPALSTLERSNPLAFQIVEELGVRTDTLDMFATENVGFIKISVGGHEMAVLHGGACILSLRHPNIIVECDERFRPDAVGSVTQFLQQFGYYGVFIWRCEVVPVKDFNPAVHQVGSNLHTADYASKFIFSIKPETLEGLS